MAVMLDTGGENDSCYGKEISEGDERGEGEGCGSRVGESS